MVSVLILISFSNAFQAQNLPLSTKPMSLINNYLKYGNKQSTNFKNYLNQTKNQKL